MEEDAQEAGGDLNVLASLGLHGAAHDAFQLRTRRRVKVQRQATGTVVSHQHKRWHYCADDGGQQQANGEDATTVHPRCRHLLLLLAKISELSVCLPRVKQLLFYSQLMTTDAS